MKKALVTLAAGPKYETLFTLHCEKNWRQYCDQFGFDLIVIKESLDTSVRASKRSAAWQKLLILSQPWSAGYDQIVWVDCDVIINVTAAYDITRNVPLDKVGAVDQHAIPTREIFDLSLTRLYKSWDKANVTYIDNLSPGSYYVNRGIPGQDLDAVIQTGVFVCSPKFHRQLFEHVYNHYEDTHGGEWNYEQPALSYELLKAGVVTWISNRFNFCAINLISAFYPELLNQRPGRFKHLATRAVRRLTKIELKEKTPYAQLQALKNIYELSIFMHFAGCAQLMPKMEEALKSS